jgi:hypothetical protein
VLVGIPALVETLNWKSSVWRSPSASHKLSRDHETLQDCSSGVSHMLYCLTVLNAMYIGLEYLPSTVRPILVEWKQDMLLSRLRGKVSSSQWALRIVRDGWQLSSTVSLWSSSHLPAIFSFDAGEL